MFWLIIAGLVFIIWRCILALPPQTPIQPKSFSPPVIQPVITTPSNIITDSRELIEWRSTQRQEFLSRQSVYDLIVEKGLNQIRYIDLINTREWYLKRLEILIRDKHTCQDCSQRNEQNLQVHHNYYLKDRLPWEIEKDALVTLCRDHHRERHNEKIIKVYKKLNGRMIETENRNKYCTRCWGMGYFPEYKHIQDGICFQCRGACFDYTIFTRPLSFVTKFDLSYEIDRILSEVTQDYYASYLSNNGMNRPVNYNGFTEPLDDLPF